MSSDLPPNRSLMSATTFAESRLNIRVMSPRTKRFFPFSFDEPPTASTVAPVIEMPSDLKRRSSGFGVTWSES